MRRAESAPIACRSTERRTETQILDRSADAEGAIAGRLLGGGVVSGRHALRKSTARQKYRCVRVTRAPCIIL